MSLERLLGVELPVIQAPMAGVQGSAMAAAVSNAGGLGSLPGALLDAPKLRDELAALKERTQRPYSVNFFCHRLPSPDAAREPRGARGWRPPTGSWASSLRRRPPAPLAGPSTRRPRRS